MARLPKTWCEVPLQEAADICDYLREPVNAKERASRHGPYPYYGATGQVGWIDGFRQDGEYVLLGEDGAPFLDPVKAKAYLVRGKCWVNNHAHVLRGRDLLCTNGYLTHALNATDYRGFANGTTRLKLTQDAMRRLPIRLAPYSEQTRIEAKIDELFSDLDASVTALKRARTNLKRYRAAVLKAAVEGKLTAEWRKANPLSEPRDVTSIHVTGPYELPPGWRWARLASVLAGIQAGKSFKCEERPPSDTEIGIVKVSAVTWGTYNEAESKTCRETSLLDEHVLIRPGDFLFSRANTLELVGACVIAKSVSKQLMLSDKILRFTLSGVVPEWLLCCLRSSLGRREIERLATGNQLSMRNIGQERIRQIRLPLPPCNEQLNIVQEVELAVTLADTVERSIQHGLTRARKVRQAILKRAFEGKLVPQDPNDEPASVLLERIRAARASGQTSGKRSRTRKGDGEQRQRSAESAIPPQRGKKKSPKRDLVAELSEGFEALKRERDV